MVDFNNLNNEIARHAAAENFANRPMLLQNGYPAVAAAVDHAANEFGVWHDLSFRNFSEAFDPISFQLRADFLRQPSISYTIHPNQKSLGLNVAKYLNGREYGSKLLSLYSDSLFGCPHLIAPELPCHSSVCLQHLCYIELIKSHLNVDLVSSDRVIQFIEFGGGYGNMARLLVHINGNVLVDIIDMPAMLLLQKSFLLTTISNKSMLNRIAFHESAPENYIQVAKNYDNISPHRHFSATFSMNETPLSIRHDIEDSLIEVADSFFVAYFDEILGIDNREWIQSFCARMGKLFDLRRGFLPAYEPHSFVCGLRPMA